MRPLDKSNVLAALRATVALLAAGLGLLGCAAPGSATPEPPPADRGSVRIDLRLGGTIRVAAIDYRIAGAGIERIGTFDVTNGTTVSGVVGDLRAGADYLISLSASDVDARLDCSGSSRFAVVAGTIASTTVHMTCHEAPPAVPISPPAVLALAALLLLAGLRAQGPLPRRRGL
jgi:hypothetical protein